MYYSIYALDAPNKEEDRVKFRPEHIKRINELNESKSLLLAGPILDKDHCEKNSKSIGSIIIAQFDDINAAENWINKDPFVVNGVYESLIVKPYLISVKSHNF